MQTLEQHRHGELDIQFYNVCCRLEYYIAMLSGDGVSLLILQLCWCKVVRGKAMRAKTRMRRYELVDTSVDLHKTVLETHRPDDHYLEPSQHAFTLHTFKGGFLTSIASEQTTAQALNLKPLLVRHVGSKMGESSLLPPSHRNLLQDRED
jgi:hypothetical protein